MPVDNKLYDRLAGTWWDERECLSHLGIVFNPPRFGYFRRVLNETLCWTPAGKRALDVGCGGGLLAEEFARLGFLVAGIDPSGPSIETARAHAKEAGLEISYEVGRGEDLPFPDASFDLVYCCDVLEHVADFDRVIAEVGRVLKPGAVFGYDTINRTLSSGLAVIKIAQEWRWTRFLPSGLHAWDQFITPAELCRSMERHRLENRDTVGMLIGTNVFRLALSWLKYKRGKIGLKALGEAAGFKIGRSTSLFYLGYAIKRP